MCQEDSKSCTMAWLPGFLLQKPSWFTVFWHPNLRLPKFARWSVRKDCSSVCFETQSFLRNYRRNHPYGSYYGYSAIFTQPFSAMFSHQTLRNHPYGCWCFKFAVAIGSGLFGTAAAPPEPAHGSGAGGDWPEGCFRSGMRTEAS